MQLIQILHEKQLNNPVGWDKKVFLCLFMKVYFRFCQKNSDKRNFPLLENLKLKKNVGPDSNIKVYLVVFG